MSTSWTIAIDWDRNGDFSGEHDDITQSVLLAEWFVGMQRPYQLTADGSTLVMRLNNKDRRFSPENEDADNPLAGKIQPLRPVRVTSNDGTTTRTRWSGWFNMIEPAANKYGARQANILATGAMQFLKATETQIEMKDYEVDGLKGSDLILVNNYANGNEYLYEDLDIAIRADAMLPTVIM